MFYRYQKVSSYVAENMLRTYHKGESIKAI